MPSAEPLPQNQQVSSLASGTDFFDVVIPELDSHALSAVVICFKTSGCPLAVASSSYVPYHSTSGCSFRTSTLKRSQICWFLVALPAECQSYKGLRS